MTRPSRSPGSHKALVSSRECSSPSGAAFPASLAGAAKLWQNRGILMLSRIGRGTRWRSSGKSRVRSSTQLPPLQLATCRKVREIPQRDSARSHWDKERTIVSKPSVFAAVVLLLTAASAYGQQDELPQEAQWAIEQSIRTLQNKGLMTTQVLLEESVGEEKVQEFLDGAVVRLILNPGGSFDAYCLEGGEVVSISLGKQRITLADEGSREEAWIRKSGDFMVPKRLQKLSLTLRAGGPEVTVNCYNKYRKSKRVVTYYVGPLDGLFCMGLVEGD